MNFLQKVRERATGLFDAPASTSDQAHGDDSSPAPSKAPEPTPEPGEKAEHEGGLERFAKSVGNALRDPKEAIYDARLGVKGRQKEVLGDAHEVSNQDIVMEQLAHAGAYGQLDDSKLAAWGYREAGAVEDPESGFRAVLYLPSGAGPDTVDGQLARAIHGGKPPPVIAFRGTSEKRAVSDDANREGVGTYQFSSNVARIQQLMQAAGGKCVVTGHSLGGALAQQAAAAFPGDVQRIVTFQSPGVNKETAEKIKEYNEHAKPEDRITSTHHRAEGDLVPMAGEALTEGDVFTYSSVGVGEAMDHTQFPLARLAAARGDLIPGISGAKGKPAEDRLVRVTHTTTDEAKSGLMPKIAESVRKTLGGLVRNKDMEPYVETWKSVQEMATSGAFTPSYVRGVIKDSDRLTDVQKDKMLLQYGGLYD